MEIVWRPDFDLCTIFILTLFILVYREKKRFTTFTGKLYDIMVLDLFFATVVEYIEVYFSHILPIATPAVKCILLCLYEVLICILAYVFSIYVFLTSRKGIYTKRRWIWYVGYFPAVAMLLIIMTTQLNRLVFYFEDGTFHMGPLYFAVYVLIGLYLLFSGVVTFVSRKTILLRNRISFYMFLLCTSIGMIYQALTVGGLVGNFCCALALVLVYIFQESNYDALDAKTNLYNKQALLMHINELINLGQSFRLIAVTPDQLPYIVHSKGSFYVESLGSQIGDRLRSVYGTTGAYSLGSCRFVVINFEGELDDIRADVDHTLEPTYKIGSEEFNLTMSGVFLQYPNDFETGDMALDLITRGMDIATKGDPRLIVTADNFEGIRDKLINRMKQEQIELEREKHEAEIAKETAESSDRAKTTFLAHMSHEIRTPLTTIMGMTEILLRDELDPDVRDNIVRINSASKSLLQIINDILDFSKIEAGRMEIINEPFEVIPTIESAINVLNVRCDSKPIKIITDIDDTIPAMLIGDDTRVKQVLFNLLSNAAKYTERGTITFSVKWDHESSTVHISVRDTGQGIREADMDKLFDSFSRFEAHANKAIEGTGLGLAITRRMIELMGGELHVESEYGKGSCFSFALRHEVSDPTPISKIDRKSHKTYHGSELICFIAPDARILIVDDNSFNRRIAEELIAPHMAKVEQADSGAACLEMVRTTHYDLIFLDHMMPGMDGFETMKRLLAMPEFDKKATPVIAFTANAISGMKELFGSAGFTDFLTKPIEVESLERMLSDYLPDDKLEFMDRDDFIAISRNNSRHGSYYDMSSVTIAGIDIATGLSHAGGSSDRFFKLVGVILSDSENARGQLMNDFESGDMVDYSIRVHAIKSNLASIGARDASALARDLEAASREGNTSFIKENHEKFIGLHKDICASLAQALSDYNTHLAKNNTPSGRPDLSGLLPDHDDCLNCIGILLRECEYEPAIQLTSLFISLCGEGTLHDELAQLEEKLRLFDYTGAATLIDSLV